MKPYYEDENVTLYHGDCRDVLAEAPVAVDLLLTDPPYGMAFTSKPGSDSIAGDGTRQGVRLVRQMLHEVRPHLADDAHALIFCHWESWPDFYDAASSFLKIRNVLIWHKAASSMGNIRSNYARDFEAILYGALGKRPILGEGRFSNVLSGYKIVRGAERIHPTEKPVDLLRHLVRRHSPEGGLVFDPFAGSGSALLAARLEGRKAVGIEIDERYCEAAAMRLAGGVSDADSSPDLGEWEDAS